MPRVNINKLPNPPPEMYDFKTVDAWVKYHLTEGFAVGVSACRKCGHRVWSAHPPDADTTKLECTECHARNSDFYDGIPPDAFRPA